MSVSGIFSSGLSSFNPDNVRSQADQLRKEFQQLGQDLQSGNLTAAQTDFAALQQDGRASSAGSQSSNPIAQAFTQLGKDLQAGNVTAAQQDFSAIQQDVQSSSTQAPATHAHHHHHRASTDANAASQVFDQLGQALQSGDLASAQQAYSTLQQDFQQSAQRHSASSTQSGSGSVSVLA